jgi:hypothetical protein
MFASRILRILTAVGNVFAATWIVPGAVWQDTAGNTIDAHGGGIVERSGTYYWTGQSASNSTCIYWASPDPKYRNHKLTVGVRRRNSIHVLVHRFTELDAFGGTSIN